MGNKIRSPNSTKILKEKNTIIIIQTLVGKLKYIITMSQDIVANLKRDGEMEQKGFWHVSILEEKVWNYGSTFNKILFTNPFVNGTFMVLLHQYLYNFYLFFDKPEPGMVLGLYVFFVSSVNL